MIARPAVLARLRAALRRSPVVALLGPRHCGKTTLARRLVSARDPNYFDLEDPVCLARLAEPMTALRPLRGLVVVDDVQRRPDLYPVLRVLADRRPQPARFLVLGGASPELLRQSAEALAGRLETVTLGGLSLGEAGAGRADRLWLRGGYPRAFLARSERESLAWRRDAIRAYVEADVPQLRVRVPAAVLLRFWTMLAHGHGGVWNAAQPARSLGVSEPTARRYLDLLTGLLLVRQLPAWRENVAKRQVKSPKVYVRDPGLLHRLLGVGTGRDLLAHPCAGASWEGFAIEETLKCVEPDAAYFWSTYQGAGLDLLLFVGDRRVGVEVRRADGPKVTQSMRIALADLRLERLVVVYPGERAYDLEDRIRVVPLASLADGPGVVLGAG